MRLEEIDIDEWDRALPSSGFEVFHTPEALEVLDEHTSAERRLYGVFKGQEAVGLLPVFVSSYGIGRTVTSPPTGMGVPRLGPIVMPTSPKQRKRESVTREFVELVLAELDTSSARSLLHMECPVAYEDPRPFQWADLEVGQVFTYVLDLADRDAEDVRSGFSRDLRKNVRRADDTDMTVSVEGVDAAMNVYDDVADRYAEQDEVFPVGRAFYRDLVSALGDRARTYVARGGDGEYLGGILVLYSNDTASFWQGGVGKSYDGVSVNSRLHWAAITDVIDGDVPIEGADVTGYDLVGANTPRLCEYKSKFGADLVPYYTVESSGVGMSVAKRAYTSIK